uniref:Accessory protein 7b n=1 Tax=Feline coronavirus TaxID=12663 RepID=A0A7G7FE27_9ALPC|nr:accessory protein 7b [Feline coronavirus]
MKVVCYLLCFSLVMHC